MAFIDAHAKELGIEPICRELEVAAPCGGLRLLARARAAIPVFPPPPILAGRQAACRRQCGFAEKEEGSMFDLTLRYRECGAECREDWLRMLACENGLPLAEVERAAARLGERDDFGRLVDWCEGHRCDCRSSRKRSVQPKLSDGTVQVYRHF